MIVATGYIHFAYWICDGGSRASFLLHMLWRTT